MMKKILTTALMASMLVTTSAQAQTYSWEEDYCSYKGDFDNKKYTLNQIKNSHYVMQQLGTLNLDVQFGPQSPAEMKQLSNKNLNALDNEYAQVKSKVEKLQVVPQAQKYKQDLLKSIKNEYTTNKLGLMAYINPAEAVKQSPAVCKSYIEPLLQSERAVQNRWLEAVEESIKEQAKDYADDREFMRSQRELAMNRYQQEKATNASFYARKNLISYHFQNCLVHHFHNPDVENLYEDTQKLNRSIFGRSFKEMCEAP